MNLPRPLTRLASRFHYHFPVLLARVSNLSPEEQGVMRDYTAARWVLTSRQRSVAADLIGKLKQEVLVLKGLSLIHGYYPDRAQRAMADIDLLVRPRQRSRVHDVLLREGWQPESEFPIDPRAQHALSYSKNRIHLDLHWHALNGSGWQGVDDRFWHLSQPLVGFNAQGLCPTHNLLHICLHGSKGSVRAAQWLLDALQILETQTIDWHEFQHEAEDRRMTTLLALSLDFLRNELQAPIPPSVISRLRATPVSLPDKLYAWTKISRRGLASFLLQPLLEYHRSQPSGSLADFVQFLCHRWHLKNWTQIPREAWSRLKNARP